MFDDYYEYINKLQDEADTEYIILLSFLALSLAMFVGSDSYSSDAAMFPRLTSAITIVGTVILLSRDYLPEPVYDALFSDTELFDKSEIVDDGAVEASETDEVSTVDRPIGDPVAAGTLIGLYVVSGLLFGILWMTPIFVFLYCIWFRINVFVSVALTILGFIVSYVFMVVLVVPLDEGILVAGGLL